MAVTFESLTQEKDWKRDPPNYAWFGRRLKELREECGLSQNQLAKRSGIGQNTISQLEASKRSDPGLVVLKALAKGLRISMNRLTRQSD